jgi:hypothetical protein
MVEKAKQIWDGAKFKDTPQVGQLKYLLDSLRDIHELEATGVGLCPLPQLQQGPQAAGIDAVNLRQIKHEHRALGLADHRLGQG